MEDSQRALSPSHLTKPTILFKQHATATSTPRLKAKQNQKIVNERRGYANLDALFSTKRILPLNRPSRSLIRPTSPRVYS